MSEANYGHFGRPAMVIAVAAGIAFLLHFFVPYGVIDYRGPATLQDDVLMLGEARDLRTVVPATEVVTGASPDLLLTGILIAVLGGVLLVALGYQALQVDAARWIGATGGLLAALGGALMFMPAMYAVGTGFTAFIGLLIGTEFVANFWAISPVLTGAAGLVIVQQAFCVMTRVAAARDGMRDAARRHLDVSLGALVLMGVVLLVPWSIGLLPDGVSDQVGRPLPGDGRAAFFFSAEDVQGYTLAELAEGGRARFQGEGDFFWASATVHAFLAWTWASFAIGLLGGLVGTARSTGAPESVSKGIDMLTYVTFLGALASALFYLLVWFFGFRPGPSPGATFLPGFWPILVPLPAWWLLRRQWAIASSGEAAVPARFETPDY